jgi:hypothetical protein
LETYAVDSPRWQTCVALAADHLIAVVLGSERLERRLDDTATETEDQVESRLLLDVVVGKSAAVLELLAGEDQTLLIRGNALLVLDLGLDIVNLLQSISYGQSDGMKGVRAVSDASTSRLRLDVSIHVVEGGVRVQIRDGLACERLHEDLAQSVRGSQVDGDRAPTCMTAVVCRDLGQTFEDEARKVHFGDTDRHSCA